LGISFSYAFIVIAVVVVIVIAKTAVVVPQQSAYVIEHLGKYSRTLQAGFHILIPFVEKITYRHSLKEEARALRIVAEIAAKDLKDGKVNTLDDSLKNLIKLNDAGLLEAYILFARPDQGISHDYDTYRKANRDKLRRYWLEVVIAAK
jgi:hypothetical protein